MQKLTRAGKRKQEALWSRCDELTWGSNLSYDTQMSLVGRGGRYKSQAARSRANKLHYHALETAILSCVNLMSPHD